MRHYICSCAVAVGVEQPMQMHDEVTHMRVVDGLLRLGLPRGVGGGIVGIEAEHVETVEILTLMPREVGECAAKNEKRQLGTNRVWRNRTSPRLIKAFV